MTATREPVALIGLGAMGSALARALLDDGHPLTVWNRTSAKTEELTRLGAVGAATPAEAVAACDVVVVCVRGYDAADAILGSPEVASSLDGTTIVQLGTGTPSEVVTASAALGARGASYLDGAIMDFPEQVGTPDCRILVSGDPDAFARARPVLDSLGGDIRYLGEDSAASAVVNSSALGWLYATSHAFMSAAALSDAAGAPVEVLAEVVGGFAAQAATLFEEYADMIDRRTYDSRNLRLASGVDNLAAIVEFGRSAGVDTGLFEHAVQDFQRALESEAGVNLAATFEVLRRPDA